MRGRPQHSNAPRAPAPGAEPARHGLVVAGHGRHYVVEDREPDVGGARLICHPRGKRSEAVVGDHVRWFRTGDQSGEGVIESIEDRRNLLLRQDEWKTKSFAANIDQLLVVVAVEPSFSESQLSRALIAAEDARIPTTVLLNKSDLPGFEAARERLAPYVRMGVDLLDVALRSSPEESRERLLPRLQGRVTLAIGPSGAGKSSLINLMVPDAEAQVGEISHALNSGRHTTTYSRWYWLDDQRLSALIDTPGFQEFGMRQVDAQELVGLMPDLRAAAADCRFYNCTHLHEPGCGVLAAVQRGDITPARHRIYAEIREELTRSRYG